MSTNIAESWNSCLAAGKKFPIYALLICIQNRLSKWFFAHRTEADNNTSWLTPKTQDMLLPRYHQSRCMSVDQLNLFECHVRGIDFEHVVNLQSGSCTCRVFNIDRIPCEHAIAALR